MRDIRNVGVGLLLGVCLMLAMGQAPARPAGVGPRYHVTPVKDENGNNRFWVLDHQTEKLYYCAPNLGQFPREGLLVEEIVQKR